VRLLCAALLGAGAAVLVACGGSGAGLIPSEDAGPLVADFQAVERAAMKGNGDCGPTKAALTTTERDFQTLPASVDTGLRRKLREGIAHLQTLALELCAEPLGQQTTTTGESTVATHPTPPPSSTKTTAPPAATTTTTSTTGESTAPGATTPSATTPSAGAEGGTAPETEGNGAEPGSESGGHEDNGLGNSGVSGNGGTGPGAHGGGQ
jgi:hypothetical protein